MIYIEKVAECPPVYEEFIIPEIEYHVPEWKGCNEKYAMNYIWKNLWRYEAIGFQFEDLLSEAFLAFIKCKKGFKGTSPRQFMAYYKVGLKNHLFKMRVDSVLDKEYLVSGCVSNMELLSEQEGDLKEMISQAPNEIKEVVSLIINMPMEVMKDIGFLRKGSRGFFNNKKVCKMLGYCHKRYNFVELLQNYFKEVTFY